MGNPHDDHEDLARPAWLDGVGPSGESLPEGFADPDWYVDPEAARLGAARLNPQWLDLSVFSAQAGDGSEAPESSEPGVPLHEGPSVDATPEDPPILTSASDISPHNLSLETAGPSVLDQPEQSSLTVEPPQLATELGGETSVDGSALDLGPQPTDEDLEPGAPADHGEPGALDHPHSNGVAGDIDLPSQAISSEPSASVETPDIPQQSAVAEERPSDSGALPAGQGGSVETSDKDQVVGEGDVQEEDDPYRPRFSVAPKSVQVSAVLQYALAGVNTLVAAIFVAVLVSSSSSLEVPFVGMSLSRPLLMLLALVFAVAAIAAVLSAIGLARGEERWWKAGFVAPVVTLWCLPLSAAAVVSLLRPDTKDWVI